MHNVTDVSEFTDPIQVLDNGDPVDAAETQPTVQGLANRTRYANDLLGRALGFTTTAQAAGTTTLLATSDERQQFTGTGGQICVLPDETLLPVGKSFQIWNNSSDGAVTVKDAAGTTIVVVEPKIGTRRDEFAIVCSTSNGTVGGNWKYFYNVPGQAVGTNTNDSALAGGVGECIFANGSNISLSTGVGGATTVASIVLTAGDWDVSGSVGFYYSGSAGQAPACGINTAPSTLAAFGPNRGYPIANCITFGDNNGSGAYFEKTFTFPAYRVSIAFGATLTLYLLGNGGTFSGTAHVSGFIQGRRAR